MERFRIVSSVTSDFIYEWNVKTESLEWFGDFEKALGYAHGEIPRTIEGWIQLLHHEDFSSLKDFVAHRSTSIKPINKEYRVRGKNGSWHFWIDRAAPVLDEHLPGKAGEPGLEHLAKPVGDIAANEHRCWKPLCPLRFGHVPAPRDDTSTP